MPSNRQLRRQADRRGFLMMGGCAIALAGVGSFVGFSRPAARDAVTACPLEGKLTTQTVVIVDRTDPWSASQRSLLRAALLAIARDIPVDGRLAIVPFDGYAERPHAPIFDRCNPGAGSTANKAVRTPEQVEAIYQETFAQPLDASLTAITKPSKAAATHLVAFLANVAGHLKYEARASATRIILFSDLGESTPQISVYAKGRGQFTPAAFTQHFNALMHDRLGGLTLDIYLMPSTTPTLTSRIKAAWVQALKSNAVTYSIKDL